MNKVQFHIDGVKTRVCLYMIDGLFKPSEKVKVFDSMENISEKDICNLSEGEKTVYDYSFCDTNTDDIPDDLSVEVGNIHITKNGSIIDIPDGSDILFASRKRDIMLRDGFAYYNYNGKMYPVRCSGDRLLTSDNLFNVKCTFSNRNISSFKVK